MKKRVVIVGGGLAGIAAAVRLLDHDVAPIILESRKMLGGRATSFVDPRTGETLDNCQHVLLGCCTNLMDLYERLGVSDLIEWHRELYWTMGHGRVDTVKAGRLPAPLHLAMSFRRMKMFSRTDKRAINRAMFRLIRMGAKGRLPWADRTFVEFLDECRQPPNVVKRFWDVIITSACNLDVRRVSAAHAIQVFQDGFLANRWSYTMGLPTVPLRRLYDPAIEMIRSRGGEVRLGVSVRSISYNGSRVSGVITADGSIDAAAVVAAVPFDRLDKLVGETTRKADARLAALDEIEVSPILGVHLFFDQPVMDLPHLIYTEGDVQWLFNKGTDEHGRQHVHAVISAAFAMMDMTEEEIVRRTVADLHAAIPGSKGIEPVDARTVKEKRATFAPTPGIDSIRPPSAPGAIGIGGGGISNLFLAGDWCDTGWPATMEGAVRSGYSAAEAITGEGGVVEDVPPGLLAAMLGLR